MSPDGNIKIHLAKSRNKKKILLHTKRNPSCLVAERVLPSIYSQHSECQRLAERFIRRQSSFSPTSLQDDSRNDQASLGGGESRQRWRWKKKAAATQQPSASVTAQPVTTQSETQRCLAPSPSLVSRG